MICPSNSSIFLKDREVVGNLSVLFQGFVLLALLICMLGGDPGSMGCLTVSRIGLGITIICAVQIARHGVLRPPFLLFVTFVLFSFGIPLLIAVDPGYSSWYLSQISQRTFSQYSWFTILCIQSYSFGLALSGLRSGKSESQSNSSKNSLFIRLNSFLFKNRESVSFVCAVLFVVFGFVAFYYSFRFTSASVDSGINAARDTVRNSNIDNLCRGLFVPTGFMLLIYSNRRSRRRLVQATLLFYALLTCLSGDRTEGLTLLVAVFVYWYWHSGRTDSSNVFKAALALIGCLVIIALVPAIASFRVGNGVGFDGIGIAISELFSELGFNFYTVCFQSQLHLPVYHGATYIASLTSLIPSSLDFLGVRAAAESLYGETIFNQAMASVYPWANFGLGYSLVAESYLNFGILGFLVICLFGFVAGLLCGREDRSLFNCYLSYSLLWAFLTVARRGFDFPINSIEYILVFLPLLVVVPISIKLHFSRRGRRASLSHKEGVSK